VASAGAAARHDLEQRVQRRAGYREAAVATEKTEGLNAFWLEEGMGRGCRFARWTPPRNCSLRGLIVPWSLRGENSGSGALAGLAQHPDQVVPAFLRRLDRAGRRGNRQDGRAWQKTQ